MSLGILLIGKTGQVGAELARFLPSLGEVVAPSRQRLDLSKPDQIRQVIREVRPHLIVNAAAYTAVYQAETEEASARATNTDVPGIMAEEAKKTNAGLVHYSTDYVFDGLKNLPYDENDPPNPLSVYGKTKPAGEQVIRDTGVAHLIFRTAWIYATSGRNFLLPILRLALQREELRVVCDQTDAPTWCREIARGTTSILECSATKYGSASFFALAGATYHMTASGVTTWYDFARAILDEVSQGPAELSWLVSATDGRPIWTRRIVPIATVEYRTPARRPAYSVLSNSRLRNAFDLPLPRWRTHSRSAFRDEDLSLPRQCDPGN